LQGWLPGLKGEGDTEQLPTIAIVANYDTFGAAPVCSSKKYSQNVLSVLLDALDKTVFLQALSVGSDSNGSGVVALLEIARLFSRLYSNPKTRGKYNLLFGLTSGGPYNYNGTSKASTFQGNWETRFIFVSSVCVTYNFTFFNAVA
jgi:hypothetical protein